MDARDDDPADACDVLPRTPVTPPTRMPAYITRMPTIITWTTNAMTPHRPPAETHRRTSTGGQATETLKTVSTTTGTVTQDHAPPRRNRTTRKANRPLRTTPVTANNVKGVFLVAQALAAAQPAPFASAASHTISDGARLSPRGMVPTLTVVERKTDVSSIPREFQCVTSGNAPGVARFQTTKHRTNAQAVEAKNTELSHAIEARRLRAHTPYNPESWHRLLVEADLLDKYLSITEGLVFGFSGGIPPIRCTYTPPNSASIIEHGEVFQQIVECEFSKGRFIGPFTGRDLESAVGSFQTAPLSLVPKPGKPGKFRLVQNLSYPINPLPTISSINSRIDSDLFPCTYGTFATICRTIWHLPPGSQGAVRDVAEAYRTVPLHQSQWAGLAIRLGEDAFAIDTSFCFGFGPSAGIYGNVADAGADIFRSKGIGPLSKWVDDHLFFRIKKIYMEEYNRRRESWANEITRNGGAITNGGRKWYRGETLSDGSQEEFDEDAHFPIRDLSDHSPRSSTEAQFTYGMEDIDALSTTLGIIWELSKDKPFSDEPPYIGLAWDIDRRTVALSNEKRVKYLDAIKAWQAKRTHILQEVQKLYGKLLHASLIKPAGRAYLTSLEKMLCIFEDRPHMARTPPRSTPDDIKWWEDTLSSTHVTRPIPGPCVIYDFNAYSDASSGHGIGIVINGKWRAWKLLPGWKRDGRDIGWAESVGFELLVQSITNACPPRTHFKVYGDNRGVVEGWWKGCSRSQACNEVFKRIHRVAANSECTILTRYVPSKENPADGPSRGIYPPACDRLPPIPIPLELLPFLAEASEPPFPPSSNPNRSDQSQSRSHKPFHPMGRGHRKDEYQCRTRINHRFEAEGNRLFEASENL